MGKNERIHAEYPFIRGEIYNAIENEMAQKPNDILCRRIPLSFLNSKAAEGLIEQVGVIMGEYLGWSDDKVREEIDEAKANMQYMV
mmetsp:Transcript_8482/g.14264  ORF Transcript_8482/g.14264 Transcript_8482/m.14264 type:complete len:86 (-) Transcript_8482:30-287(-)